MSKKSKKAERKAAAKLEQKSSPADVLSDGFWGMGWGMTAAGTRVNSFTAMQSSAVLSCVAILSEDLAKLPVAVYERLEGGGRKLAKDHFLTKLLQCPNDWQTRFEFVQMMQACLVLRSDAYAVILRDGRKSATALIPIHPDFVRIWESPDGEIYYIVTRNGLHDTAALREVPMAIHSEDILHVKWMSTARSIWGTSRISLLREAVGLNLALDESTARVIAQAARPGGLLSTEAKLSPEQGQHIVSEFMRHHSGPENSGGVGLLEQGMTYTPLDFTAPESLVQQRSFQLAEIARGMRVPLYKLGVIEAGDKSDRALIDQGYLNDTLVPYCENWSQRLAKTFDLEDRYSVEWDFTHFLRADLKTRIDAARSGVLGSIYSIDEAREEMGLPKLELVDGTWVTPDGGIILQPANMVPLGYIPPEKTATGEPGSDATGDPARDGDGDNAAKPDDPGAPAD